MNPCLLSAAAILGVEPITGLEEKARNMLGCDPAHGWPHILRVARWSARIVENEHLSPDWRVLYLSIVLHDVGRSISGKHHAIASAEIAEELLASYDLEDLIGQVRHAILAHSYSLGREAQTTEARILSDADKLDALGAIGIARVFHTGCQLGRQFHDSIQHFYDKILRLPTLMYYEYSRRQARELVSRVETFLSWVEQET